jgi:hypothetical protein
MRSRVAALAIALGAIGFATGAFSIPTFTSAESKVPIIHGSTDAGTEASVGVASAFEDTCSLLGRQQTGEGCDSVAAPTEAPGSLTEAVDALIASLRQAIDLIRQQIAAQIEPPPPAAQKQSPAPPTYSEPTGATPPGAAQTNQTPLQDEVNALQDAIHQHVQSQIEKALTGKEPPTTRLGGSAPGCTTEQEVVENSIRTTVRCSQRQVSTNGSSSTSTVQTSSSSVSVSSSSSSDSR